jgi:cell division protein FtsN
MVDAGIAVVDARIVEWGKGDRAAPAPYVVTITPPAEAIGPPPDVAFPLSGGREAPPEAAPAVEDDVVENVVVVDERQGQRVTKRVAADGVTIETVREDGTVVEREAPTVAAKPAPRRVPPPAAVDRFVIQFGAFGVEENAQKLRAEIAAVDSRAFVELRGGLWRVRMGPFPNREAASREAGRLADAGYPGIVLRAE